jgi:hypothetical protein
MLSFGLENRAGILLEARPLRQIHRLFIFGLIEFRAE